MIKASNQVVAAPIAPAPPDSRPWSWPALLGGHSSCWFSVNGTLQCFIASIELEVPWFWHAAPSDARIFSQSYWRTGMHAACIIIFLRTHRLLSSSRIYHTPKIDRVARLLVQVKQRMLRTVPSLPKVSSPKSCPWCAVNAAYSCLTHGLQLVKKRLLQPLVMRLCLAPTLQTTNRMLPACQLIAAVAHRRLSGGADHYERRWSDAPRHDWS